MDALTGLLDRQECLSALARMVESEHQQVRPLCLLWLSIDRFRQINASFGHGAGDNVLAKLAYRLRTTIERPEALLGRIGGDEFIVVLPSHSCNMAEELARALLVAAASPLEVGQVRLRPSISIGIAEMGQDEGPAQALERADRAMYAAKSQGGGRFVHSGEEPITGRFGNPLAREELAIEELLHEALETGGLSLHYQPILTFAGELEALEALMRCEVQGRSLSPGQFIPVAEKTGLIIRLGEWSLLTAAKLAEALLHRGQPTKVAVNISRAQLTAPRFAQVLHAVLACSDVPAHLLELELTESLFMDQSETVRRNLDAALDAGFPLAIDDFGTGYSCLAYLKDLPAKKLKLDRAFVMGLPEDTKSFAIVRTIAHLARELGMMVVAEGVETHQQYQCLQEAGVMAVQGFIFSRAMSEIELDVWLNKRSLACYH